MHGQSTPLTHLTQSLFNVLFFNPRGSANTMQIFKERCRVEVVGTLSSEDRDGGKNVT